MTLGAALYARCSSGQQRSASIEDQFRVCREHADREGWRIAGAYRDAAVSGASMILRPGVQALLEDARQLLLQPVQGQVRRGRDSACTRSRCGSSSHGRWPPTRPGATLPVAR